MFYFFLSAIMSATRKLSSSITTSSLHIDFYSAEKGFTVANIAGLVLFLK